MKTLKRFFRYERAGWLFVLPGLLYMLVFVGYPIVYNIVLSLQDVTQKNLISGERHFVALKNYITLFHDNVFLHSIGNTLLYTVCCLVLQFVIGFALALFFTKKFSFSKPVRGLLMMPWMIPITVTALMYESASIDGAGKLDTFFKITLPLLRPTIESVLILGFIYTFKVFDLVFVMTGGGPVNSTQMLSTYSYKLSFDMYKYSMGSAVANVLFVLLMLVGMLYLRATREESAA